MAKNGRTGSRAASLLLWAAAALLAMPGHAAWDYSLAAKLALHDGPEAICGKIEPRLVHLLDRERKRLLEFYGAEQVQAAGKSDEYSEVLRLVQHEQLKNTFGDPEEEAHACEDIYYNLYRGDEKGRRWWNDRMCADVSLDAGEESALGRSCGTRHRAEVEFSTTLPGTKISILRLSPSSDIAFPAAGAYPRRTDPQHRIVEVNQSGRKVWAIPETVEMEWKEWPDAFPAETRSERELQNAMRYAGKVRSQVRRKHVQMKILSRLPADVLADVEKAEQAPEPGQPAGAKLKLFFIFMKDGPRFRWEHWRGQCIASFGGDAIDLPRDRLLSGDRVCGEPQSKPCNCEAKGS